MKQNMNSKWGAHEDMQAKKINLMLLPISIIGTKFDAFANAYDTQVKK